MKHLIQGILCVLIVSVCCGRNSGLVRSHGEMFDTMRGMGEQVASRLGDGTMGQMAAGGQAIEPGIEIEAGMKYHASARYRGLAGQFSIAASGPVKGATEADKAALDAIVRDKSLSDAERAKRIQALLDRVAAAAERRIAPGPTGLAPKE